LVFVIVLPSALQHHAATRIMTVACCKPDIYTAPTDTQNLNVQVFEPSPNYICALPGKMTEAPYLGRAAAAYTLGKDIDMPAVGKAASTHYAIPAITARPVDHWAARERITTDNHSHAV
jgi:hypothetical protein